MKKLQLVQRLKNMKPGDSFTVSGERERQKVCRAKKFLEDAELLDHQIITLHLGNFVFKVAAV